MPDPSKPTKARDPRIDAALREYLERIDRGELVDREKFIARHAEIAEALRSFLATEEPLRKIAQAWAPGQSAGISTQSFAAQGQETVAPRSKSDRSAEVAGSGFHGQLGRYRIVRTLGSGAMGTVYLAEDTELERKVALKTPHFEDDPTGELVARFYREARAAATLRHAHICPVYDVGQIDGRHFISMAYIEGRPLSEFIGGDKPRAERQVLIAIQKLALALQHAHDHGIVHRDLKPSNIMVDKKGEPIIMDFGLARKARKEGEASLTQNGMLLGSPAYMSPEQIEGDPESVGPASDQYSLGVVLYEMLTRQLPFRGSVVNVLAQILTKDLTRPSELRPGLDPRIEAVCLRMMAKKTSDRFPSMKAVAEELYAILKSPAAEPIADAKSPTASRSPATPAPSPGDAQASQIRKSVKHKVLTESDLTSLEELVRKCLRRRDYDQMLQIVERIPEDRRTEALQTLLEKAREKVDEISFLICEIDEADRLNDGRTALKKAEELLTIKPEHHRAREIQEKYSGYGDGGAARIGPLSQLTKPWSEGGWIPWSVLAFGLIVFAGMYGVMVIYLGKTAIVIDIKDPGVEVAVKGTTLTVTGPDKQSVKVEPGDQELKITSAGLETAARSFSLKKGETKTVTVSIVNKEIVARLENQVLPLTSSHEERVSNPGANGEKEVAKTASAQGKPAVVVKGPSDLPVPPKKLSATVSTTASDSARNSAADPDRRAAEWVLSIGGRWPGIERDGEVRDVDVLPPGPFKLRKVDLYGNQKVTDAGLACFKGCNNLKELSLYVATKYTDAGLAVFKGYKNLSVLYLSGHDVTDTGLANFKECKGLTTLAILDTKVSDQGLAYFKDCKDLEVVELRQSPRVADAGVAPFLDCPKLKELNLYVTNVTDAGLTHLDRCVNLEVLTVNFNSPAVTDATVRKIAGLRRLKKLGLGGTQLTNAGLASLEGLTQLETLMIDRTAVRGPGLAHLRHFVRLKELQLGPSGLTDGDLVHIRNLKALERLGLWGTRVSGPGLANLKEMDLLRDLDLNDSRMTNSGLEHLKNLRQLEKLHLRGTQVTDAGLHHLEGLTNLDELDLTDTKVTAAGVETLQKSLPACKIIVTPKAP
jgi:serine/threonine protein kinase/Leucine-rich repeat (LRR) protein